MSSRVVLCAFLVLACVSPAVAGEWCMDRPVVVSAPTVWPSSPVPADRPPVLIMDPVPYAPIANKGQVCTPLPHPGYAPTMTYRPLVPLMPVPGQYYVGRGVVGQPKVYVPGQPIRNFLRYLSP